MPSKEEILTAIKRETAANGGNPPGMKRFEDVTGIKRHMWSGRYWARWSDLLADAGLATREWGPLQRPDDDELKHLLASLARELGHFPSNADQRFRRANDKAFPDSTVFRTAFGGADEQRSQVYDWATAHEGWEDVADLLAPLLRSKVSNRIVKDGKVVTGYVYLMLSGRHYKIGQSNHVGRRAYEVSIQLPERLEVVHEIATDDPEGIEAYWHRRFAAKRANGEWFNLTSEDVATFKQRTYM